MTSPYADLRARLAPLAAAATEEQWHLGADLNAESGDPDVDVCNAAEVMGPGKWVDVIDDAAPDGSYRTFEAGVVADCSNYFGWPDEQNLANAAFIVALRNNYPDIDALLARGEAAEAENEGLLARADEAETLLVEECAPLIEPLLARGEAAEAESGALRGRAEELHEAIVEYLAEFDYPTTSPAWERLRAASAAAAVALRMPGRFGDPS